MKIIKGLPASLSGLGIPADGDLAVGGGGHMSLLHKGAADAVFRMRRDGSIPAWLRAPYATALDRAIIADNFPGGPLFAVNNGAVGVAGSVYLAKIYLPEPTLITSLTMLLATAATGNTNAFFGIYQGAGGTATTGATLLGATADQTTGWNSGSGSIKTVALGGGPANLAAGEAYIAYLFVGGTGPSWRSGNTSVAFANFGLPAASSLFGIADTGRTTLPATLGTVTGNNTATTYVAAS